MTLPVHAEQEAFRRAVQACDFAAAENSARSYRAALQSALPALPPERACQLLREACELTEWARRTLCAGRARLNDELRRVQRLAAYHGFSRPDLVHTWKIDV
jgi:hypothetical protein